MRRGLLAATVALVLVGAGALLAPLALAAPPGKLVFVSNRDGDDEIFTMNADGSSQTQLTFNGDFDQDPSWSPDGKRIAFISARDPGLDSEIWIMGIDGSSPRQVTFNDESEFSMDWAPDSRRLVFGMDDAGSANQFFVINADGTGIRQLTFFTAPSSVYGSHFSPDGTQIVFTNQSPGSAPVAVFPAAGGAPVGLTPISGYAPDYTGSGARIVFYSDESADGGSDDEIFSIAANGADLRQLTSNSGPGSGDRAPSPSRDGLNRIAWRSDAGGDQEVWVMNSDGTGAVPLTNNAAADRGADWQPTAKCGKGIATIVGTAASETLRGGPGPDIISGQGGKDKIKGLGGKDTICGDAGNDNLNGGAGKDQLIGGKGKDKTVGGKGKDRCVGGKGADKAKACEKVKSL